MCGQGADGGGVHSRRGGKRIPGERARAYLRHRFQQADEPLYYIQCLGDIRGGVNVLVKVRMQMIGGSEKPGQAHAGILVGQAPHGHPDVPVGFVFPASAVGDGLDYLGSGVVVIRLCAAGYNKPTLCKFDHGRILSATSPMPPEG